MSNTLPTDELRNALTLLTNFAARQTRLRLEGKPIEGNITDKEAEFLALIDLYTNSKIAKMTSHAAYLAGEIEGYIGHPSGYALKYLPELYEKENSNATK